MRQTYFDAVTTRKLSSAHNPLPDFSYGHMWIHDPIWIEVMDVDFGFFMHILNFKLYCERL